MTFSRRIGITADKTIQLKAIDGDLKNSIWNVFSALMHEDFIKHAGYPLINNPYFEEYINAVWSDFLKLPIDDIRNSTPNYCMEEIRSYFFSTQWYRIYEFIEFNVGVFLDFGLTEQADLYIEKNNKVLKRESSGYRIVDNIVIPISNEIELEEIQSILENTSINNVNTHIKTALILLSDRSNPDYRNSIKESISAVETLCREITGENTLGKAINNLEKSGLKVNTQFKEALEKLYAYSNNKETGIRHAILDSPQTPLFDEAKFMIVICSAFINYLISKKSI